MKTYHQNQGIFKLVANDHEHQFLILIISREMGGDPNKFYTQSPKIEEIVS